MKWAHVDIKLCTQPASIWAFCIKRKKQGNRFLYMKGDCTNLLHRINFLHFCSTTSMFSDKFFLY